LKIARRKKLKEKPKPSNENHALVKMDDNNTPDGISHQEFRLGAFLLLPMIDPKDAKSPKDQISIDPISIRNKHILGFYSKNRDVVDKLNLAYATMQSVGQTKSKATPLGYYSIRGEAINDTANRNWMDASGKEYPKFMDVPEQTRNFLLKFLQRKIETEEKPNPDVTTPDKEVKEGVSINSPPRNNH